MHNHHIPKCKCCVSERFSSICFKLFCINVTLFQYSLFCSSFFFFARIHSSGKVFNVLLLKNVMMYNF